MGSGFVGGDRGVSSIDRMKRRKCVWNLAMAGSVMSVGQVAGSTEVVAGDYIVIAKVWWV